MEVRNTARGAKGGVGPAQGEVVLIGRLRPEYFWQLTEGGDIKRG